MKSLFAVVVALLLIAQGANGQNKTPDKFYVAAWSAAFTCELRSDLYSQAIGYGSPERFKDGTDTGDCVNDKTKALADAYKAIPDSKGSVKSAAKAVYSAWLAYGDALGRGLSSDQAKNSEEGITFRKVLSDYEAELDLTQ